MPKTHNIGKQHFVQYTRLPLKWGWKLVVKGWTQEIEEPFRTAKPYLFRLPFYRVIIVGRWTGQLDEDNALALATEMRVLADEDFSDETGWQPPDETSEKDIWDFDA
jgi:hypothetical protein